MEREEEQTRKRHKCSNGEQNALSVDRLSDLPDPLICHILSFLPTKSSVRTSVLGQRWRHLWTYVPELDFSRANEDFIDKVMSLHRIPDIITFRLKELMAECNGNQIERWISFAIERNVQNLELYYPPKNVLPQCLFTCQTLVDLRIYMCGTIIVGGTVFLPRLKKLSLIHVRFDADESLPHLLSGCPVLEDLVVESLCLVYFNISSPTLKSLCFKSDGYRFNNIDDRLAINTPALRYLKIDDCLSNHIETGPLTSLLEADIKLHNHKKKQNDLVYSRSALEFIDSLRHTKCLTLNLAFNAKIVNAVFSSSAISFHNLNKLELFADFCVLSKFLENADNLEILIYWEISNGSTRRRMEPPQQVPTCVSSRLRVIKLIHISGEEKELEMIGYLMRNGKVLERMEIAYARFLDFRKTDHMHREIPQFERGSKACEVAFSTW